MAKKTKQHINTVAGFACRFNQNRRFKFNCKYIRKGRVKSLPFDVLPHYVYAS
jgi:hypothetical protein